MMVTGRDISKRKGTLAKHRLTRSLYIFAGTVFLVLGVIGVVLPVLPTTPFLLLTAYCYARGSEKLHFWLMTNRVFGKYILDYQRGKGIPAGAKGSTVILLWAAILASIYLFISDIYIQMILIIIAGFVTAHIALLPTKRH